MCTLQIVINEQLHATSLRDRHVIYYEMKITWPLLSYYWQICTLPYSLMFTLNLLFDESLRCERAITKQIARLVDKYFEIIFGRKLRSCERGNGLELRGFCGSVKQKLGNRIRHGTPCYLSNFRNLVKDCTDRFVRHVIPIYLGFILWRPISFRQYGHYRDNNFRQITCNYGSHLNFIIVS